MTGFKIAEEWLDWGATLGLEIRSPLFDTGSIPGVLSYPTSITDTPRNRRLLGFPAVRTRQVGPVPAIDADFYIGGVLWRRGVLEYQEFDSPAGTYSYQFKADADALATRIQDVLLSELALPTVPTQFQAETADYVLFPVRNNTFYDAEKNTTWGKVVNYFDAAGALQLTGIGFVGHPYTVTPFLKVVPLLRAALGLYGYSVGGPWVDDPEIQQLVVYSTTSLDRADFESAKLSFALNSVLPDVRLAELLLVLQQMFALGFVFNPVRKEVRIVPLREVATGAGYQVRRAAAGYKDKANDTAGFTLAFTADTTDELLKGQDWPQVVVGAGGETIQPALDPLRMVREADPWAAGREWLVPAAEQPGRSDWPAFEQATVRSSHLRLLFYRGLQPDSTGALYPLGTAGTVNYAGDTVGDYALEWDGPNGLYQKWHKPWLDFRANSRTEERTVALTLGEFTALDPTEKEWVEGLKFLWENVSITVGGTETLSDATITYHQIAH
jgi:hypothetical protein